MYGLTMTFASFLLLTLPTLCLGQSVFVSNLDATCLRCLCISSTGCNEKFQCSPEGFCDGGYLDCVTNYQCASDVVVNYMANEGWDCNNDGVTDCDDYARIHYVGPDRCDKFIGNNRFYQKFLECRPQTDNFSLVRK